MFENMDQVKFALGKYVVRIFRANSPCRRYLMQSFNVLTYFTLWGSVWLAFAHFFNKKTFGIIQPEK